MLASEFKIPPKVPAGHYRIDVRAYNEKNQTLVFPRVYMTVKAKGIADLTMGWLLMILGLVFFSYIL